MSQSLMCLEAKMQGPGGMFSAPSTSVLMPTSQRSRNLLELTQYMLERPADLGRAAGDDADGADEDREDHGVGRATPHKRSASGSPERSSARPGAGPRRYDASDRKRRTVSREVMAVKAAITGTTAAMPRMPSSPSAKRPKMTPSCWLAVVGDDAADREARRR